MFNFDDPTPDSELGRYWVAGGKTLGELEGHLILVGGIASETGLSYDTYKKEDVTILDAEWFVDLDGNGEKVHNPRFKNWGIIRKLKDKTNVLGRIGKETLDTGAGYRWVVKPASADDKKRAQEWVASSLTEDAAPSKPEPKLASVKKEPAPAGSGGDGWGALG